MNSYSSLPRRLWLITATIMAVLGAAFHITQNSGAVPGGTVPLVKSAWLFTVLYFWYVMPASWLCDSTLAAPVRVAFAVALANMVLRALVELPLMYKTQGWLHAYGIWHDIFSIALNLLLILWLNNKTQAAEWAPKYFLASAVLFGIEAIFALYLRSTTAANGTVFFLPADQKHTVMLIITGVAVLLTWFASAHLLKQSYDQHA